MTKLNNILKCYTDLQKTKYWINFLENWNKENGTNYKNFSNKITNGNGCMSLKWLIGETVRLEMEIASKKRKLQNYYKNNFKVETNKIFQ